MPQRLSMLREWVTDRLGGGDLTVETASDDASFRRYFRVLSGSASYIVMDAPPDKEPLEPWLSIAACLCDMGLDAPQVLGRDDDRGFVLMSDLGAETYLDALNAGAKAEPLYRSALDALLTLQSKGRATQAKLPPYDRDLLMTEMALFRDWLFDRHLSLAKPAGTVFTEAFDFLAESALGQPRVFVHRDYHSRNLMTGGSPGILDFQDAMHGPVTYDLVSLLKDCYVEWPERRVVDWALGYRSSAAKLGIPVGDDDAGFLRWFELMGVQRHLKAAGIFARLFHRDGKAGYLSDIPRTLGYVVAVTPKYPELAALDGIVRRVLERLGNQPETDS